MVRLIFFVAVLAGISWGGAWLLEHRGLVEVKWLGYEIRTTVAFTLAAIFTGVLALLFAVQLVLWVFSLPERAKRTREARQVDRAMLALTRGFAAIAAADARGARAASREAQKLLAHHEQGSQLALILAAESDQLEGNHARAEEKFTALLQHKSTEFLGLKGLLIEAQSSGDSTRALEIAEKAYAARPDGQGIARLLLALYKRLGKWESARGFLKAYTRRRRFSLADQPAEIDTARELAMVEVMQARALEATDTVHALKIARDALASSPDFLPAAELVTRLALVTGDKALARRTIEKQWRIAPTAALGDAYLALSNGEKPQKRVRHALKLLNLRDHPESHAAAAKAYLEAGDTTSARNQMKLALAEGETVRLCTLMGEIEDAAGDRGQAQLWQERALHALPDAGWECRECHTEQREWLPVCPACEALDKVQWVHHGRVKAIAQEQ